MYTSDQLYDIGVVKALLKENGIETVEVSKKDSAYISVGEIELYVQRENFIRSKHIIDKNGW